MKGGKGKDTIGARFQEATRICRRWAMVEELVGGYGSKSSGDQLEFRMSGKRRFYPRVDLCVDGKTKSEKKNISSRKKGGGPTFGGLELQYAFSRTKDAIPIVHGGAKEGGGSVGWIFLV